MKPCPNCKAELADNAAACPQCGQRMSTASSLGAAVIIGVIVGGFLLWFLTRNL